LYKTVFTILLGILCTSAIAQPSDQRLREVEISVRSGFMKIKQERDDHKKEIIGDTLFSQMQKGLSLPSSFTYSFDSLKFIGKLMPSDSGFSIVNWTIPLSDGTYLYYLLLQTPDSSQGTSTVFPMKKRSATGLFPDSCTLTSDQWYGAVYYQILVNPADTGKIYTLLGFDPNNFFTARKIIDVLSFDSLGRPLFGAPIFRYPDHTACRVLFEYSAQVSMMLRYDTALDMIVFDHLSPSEPGYEGVFQFYGPDFSYDGFIFSQGKWNYRKDLDIRNKPFPSTNNR
jgi:hypothetical protein